MTPADLSTAIASLFGAHKGALADAARALPSNYSNLRQMLAARRPIPAWLAERLAELRRLRDVAPPPATLRPEDDRDEPCGQALDPHMDDLARRAEAAGWHPAEITAAVLDWAIHAAIEGAGAEAARQMLDDAREVIALMEHAGTAAG